MARHIELEPVPRRSGLAQRADLPSEPFVYLPRKFDRPNVCFFDVLEARRSATGGKVDSTLISSVLWHSMFLRERRHDGFGTSWESRATPSAGGLHPTRLIVLSLEESGPNGVYDDRDHALLSIMPAAVEMNRHSVLDILGATTGTTIQFATDAAFVEACYENSRSLIWRDAGALITTICLVATALGLVSTPVGRTGDAIVRASGLSEAFIGTGAIHLGTPENGA